MRDSSSAGPAAAMGVVSVHVTPEELAALIVVCAALARRPAAGPAPGAGRRAAPAPWGRPDQDPAFHLAHSWRAAAPRLAPGSAPVMYGRTTNSRKDAR